MDSTELLTLRFHQHLKTKTTLAEVTLGKYKTALNRFKTFVFHHKKSIDSLTHQDLVFFLNELTQQGYSPSAVQECSIMLKKFFCYLHAHFGYRDIAYNIKSPVKPETFTITQSDLKEIISYAADYQKVSTRDSLILYLYFMCKVPPRSIVALQAKDVDFYQKSIFDASRSITVLLPSPWSDRLKAFMYQRDRSEPYLFYGNDGITTFSLTPQTIVCIIRKAINTVLKPHAQHNSSLFFKKNESDEIFEDANQESGLKRLYTIKHPRS